MKKDQLSIMYVGGPNSRTDFHLDQGSEFFYQVHGNMFVVIMEKGKRRRIDIREGEVITELILFKNRNLFFVFRFFIKIST